jgi:hypothetical protein
MESQKTMTAEAEADGVALGVEERGWNVLGQLDDCKCRPLYPWETPSLHTRLLFVSCRAKSATSHSSSSFRTERLLPARPKRPLKDVSGSVAAHIQ